MAEPSRAFIPETRRALETELVAINGMLEEASLPPLPRSLPLANVLVALEEGKLIGAIAIEVAVRRGLLRSVVVAEPFRGQGVGASLMKSALSRCNELGLRDVYVFDATGGGFSERFGFEPVASGTVPREIQALPEYAQRAAPDGVRVLTLTPRF